MRQLPRLALAVAASALLLVGCSDSTDPNNFEPNGLGEMTNPVEIFQEGAETTTSSDDVTVVGEVSVNGDASKMTSRFGGPKAESTVKSGKSGYEVKADEGALYVRGDVLFWTDLVGRSQALSIGDRWVVSPKDGPLAAFNYFVDLNSFFRASGNIKKGQEVEVAGRPAIKIIDPPKGTDSTWAFATTGDPVALEFRSGKTTSLAFDYDVTNLIDIPSPTDTVPATDLKLPKSAPKPS